MTNLHFNKIVMHNFMSFDDTEIELSNLGTAIVSGKNNHKVDNAESNGSGKSSIFNAICYALTGETTQGLKDSIENIYADPEDCWVELDLNVDNDRFIIRRIKSPRSDLKIYINGEDKSGKGIKESSELLKSYIPDLNSMLLCSIIILGQGLPSKFTDGHPGLRKEKLEKLTKSDYLIQSIREKLDLRQDELRSSLRSHQDSLIEITTKIDMYSKQLESSRLELVNISSYNSEYTLDDRLVYLHKKIRGLIDDEANLINEISIKNETMKIITQDKSDYLVNYSKSKNDDCSGIEKEIKELEDKIIVLKTNIKSLTKEIKSLKLITDVCPTCGQKIPGAHKVDTTEKETELNSLEEELNNLQEDLNVKNSDKDLIIKKIDDIFNKKLVTYDNSLNDLSLKVNELNNGLTNLQQRIQRNKVEQAKVQGMKDNYDKINASVTEIETLLIELEELKSRTNSLIIEDNEHLKVIQDLITLTKKEFRGVLLQSVIEYIDRKVKYYSQVVFNTDLLSFTLNDNYIDIKYDGKYYEALSGGEKQKVDVIIQLAIRDLLSKKLKIHSNLLVLDEVFDNLDSLGCQRILDLISNIDDIESTFIISHHVDELQISYDTEIVVEKDNNGISHINIV